MTTAKEAKETKVFTINENSVIETNLFDHVMESVDQTTAPTGVTARFHIRHQDFHCYHGRRNQVNNDKGNYEVWTWGILGNNPKFIEEFETEEEAENWLFERVYEYDFMSDDQRDTSYYSTYEEAENECISIFAERSEIDFHVAKSILNHQKCADNLKEIRQQNWADAAKANKERVEKIAVEYSKLIEKVATESYKETAARLSHAIGDRIEKAVFHAAVKQIRNK